MHRWALLLFLIAATFEVAAQPITRVFRVDVTPPEDAFAHGFQANGFRTNVLAHAIGGACHETLPTRASVWVSTTHDRNQAVRLAEAQLGAMRGQPDATVWIYTIRPDETYMSVEWLVRQVILEGEISAGGRYTPTHADTLRWLLARTSIGSDREVISQRVLPANIVDAVPARYAGGRISFGIPVPNVVYRNAATSVNTEIHDVGPYIPPASIRLELYDAANIASCSMSCDGASSSASNRLAMSSPAEDYCLAYRQGAITPVMQMLLLD